jgi:hypothetical protein
MWDWKYCLIELKGSFLINIGLRNNKFFVEPVFILKIEKEALSILESLKKEFGVGNIVENKKYASYIVRGINDCLVFASKIDERKFLTSKKKDFSLWKIALEKIKNFEHLKKEGFLSICEIRDRMNLEKKRKNYKSKKYFEKLIEKGGIKFENNFEKRKRIAENLRKTYSLRNLRME